MAKLGTVFLLFWAEDNRLVLYAVALMTVGILLNIIYAIYCKRNFTTCRFRFYFDRKLLKEMLFFSSWSLFGGIAHVASIQGISILLNIFFTVAVNAAMGVASQVFSAVNTLVTNFQKAVQPQIVQSYFQGINPDFWNLFSARQNSRISCSFRRLSVDFDLSACRRVMACLCPSIYSTVHSALSHLPAY